MAKKASIPFHDLVPIYFNNNYYYIVRYRISALNKNRFSEWSPFYDIKAPSASQLLGGQTVSPIVSKTVLPDNLLVNVYWNVPESIIDVTTFDVFIRWFDPATSNWTDWSYFGTEPQGPIVIPKGSSLPYSKLEVSVHLPSHPKAPTVAVNFPSGGFFQNNDTLNDYLKVFSLQIDV